MSMPAVDLEAPPTPRFAPLPPAAFVTLLIAGVVLLNLFVITLVGLSVQQSHRQYQERAEITTRNLAHSLDSDIAGTIEKVGVSLFAVKDEYEKHLAAGKVPRQGINAYIARLRARLHFIDGLRIADEHGRVIYGEDVAPGSRANLSDRDHFVRQRDRPDAGLVISRPVKSRVNKQWVLVFTRRLNHPDGSFAGIVLAAVKLDYLAQVFSALDVGPSGVVTLLDGELGIVARYSQVPGGASVGQRVASRSLRQFTTGAAKSGSYLAQSAVDGIERTFSFRRVGDHPLIIIVGVAVDDYLAAWRGEAARQAALAALFALITATAAWLIFRSRKRQVGANAALASQEAKFRTLADFTLDWEYWRDPRGAILYMTPSCERVTGHARDEFVAEPGLLLRMIHPEDRRIVERHLLDIAGPAATTDEAQIEFRIVRRDGEIRWLAHHCRAIVGRAGEPLGRRVSNRDITARKRAEQALRASERNLAAAQALAHVGSWELDLATNRLTWSEEMYRIFGMTEEQFGAAYETFLNALHPDDRERVDQAYRDSLRPDGSYDIEYRLLRRCDGQMRWGHACCEHERDAAGRALRSLGTVQDITARKQLESLVERERTRLQTILTMASDGIHILAGDGVLVEANEAFLEMLGYDDSAIGTLRITDWALVSWAEAKAHIDELTRRRVPEVFETRHRHRDGTILDVEISASLIEIEGRPYIYAASRDIGARKRAEAELIAAKQAAENASLTKTRFLAAASHDLRQPLQAIGMFHETLMRTGLNEKQERIVQHMTTSVRSLGELLNKLLDISRLDADMIRPRPAVILPWDLLGTLDAEFAPLAVRKGLRFDLYCPLQGLALFSDPNLLLDLLRNLVGNAVKYTQDGGILVSVRRRGGRGLIQVWDTGIGIAPEYLDTIFEEYFQVGNAEQQRARGVGLGLAIVRRLSGLLGSQVHCRSRPGRGSLFELGVPLADGPAARAGVAHADEDAVAQSLAGKRVVIIEDDPLAGQALRLALETQDLEVTAFTSAEAALAGAAAAPADYYISDFRLPGMDGVELLDAIQQASPRPIRAVLLTGDTSPARVRLAQSSGWTVVFKPVDLPRLLAALTG